MVRRVYVEKKPGFRTEGSGLLHDLKSNLNLKQLEDVRVLHRYDVENIPEEVYRKAVARILSEAPVDDVYEENLPEDVKGHRLFATEYLPGQYDQRGDSAEQCIRILKADENPTVKCANVYVLTGDLTEEEVEKVKAYCINAVDSREASMDKPETLETEYGVPDHVETLKGFNELDEAGVEAMIRSMGLAMSKADLLHTQKYFRDVEHRDPTVTEIRVLDTYWSDHCRHTTFATVIEDVKIDESPLTGLRGI